MKLYRLTKNNQVQIFEIRVKEGDDNDAALISYKGLLGGKMQMDIKEFTQGKNLGRANETTPFEQAVSEGDSMARKLMDKGYVKIPRGMHEGEYAQYLSQFKGKDASGNLRPMLAQKKLNIKSWPVYVQRKYDGIRSFSRMNEDGEIEITSRNGKPFEYLRHIEHEISSELFGDVWDGLGPIPQDWIIDGELYSHEMTFQQIVSSVKRQQDSNQLIHLRIYDFGCSLQQGDRMEFLISLNKMKRFRLLYIDFVETFICYSMEEIQELHAQFLEEGYEGTMVRTGAGNYEYGTRSHTLMKHKEFDEDEFTIINVLEAEGRDKGTAIFECEELVSGKQPIIFRARPMGTRELRAEYWENRKNYIGKVLTVKYQGRSEEGIPRFPVGKGIRDYE